MKTIIAFVSAGLVLMAAPAGMSLAPVTEDHYEANLEFVLGLTAQLDDETMEQAELLAWLSADFDLSRILDRDHPRQSSYHVGDIWTFCIEAWDGTCSVDVESFCWIHPSLCTGTAICEVIPITDSYWQYVSNTLLVEVGPGVHMGWTDPFPGGLHSSGELTGPTCVFEFEVADLGVLIFTYTNGVGSFQ